MGGGDGGGALLDDCPCDGDEGGEGTGKAGDEEGEEVKEEEKEEDLDPEELERRRQAAEEEERRRQEEELRKQEEERKRKEEEKAKKAQLDAELKEMFDGVREKKEEENERRSSGGEDEGQKEVEEEWVESKRDQTYLSKLVRKGGDGDVDKPGHEDAGEDPPATGGQKSVPDSDPSKLNSPKKQDEVEGLPKDNQPSKTGAGGVPQTITSAKSASRGEETPARQPPPPADRPERKTTIEQIKSELKESENEWKKEDNIKGNKGCKFSINGVTVCDKYCGPGGCGHCKGGCCDKMAKSADEDEEENMNANHLDSSTSSEYSRRGFKYDLNSSAPSSPRCTPSTSYTTMDSSEFEREYEILEKNRDRQRFGFSRRSSGSASCDQPVIQHLSLRWE